MDAQQSNPSTETSNDKTRLESLNEKGHNLLGKVTDTIHQGIDKVKDLVSTHKDSAENKADEKASEVKEAASDAKETVKEAATEWDQPLGSLHRPKTDTVEVRTEAKVQHKVEEVENKLESALETGSDTTQESHQSIADRVKEGITGITSQITHQVENLKDHFRHKEGDNTDNSASQEGNPSVLSKIKEGVSNTFCKSRNHEEKTEKDDNGGFHKVQDGFNETVDELNHEQGKDKEYKSANPFGTLEGETTEEAAKKGLIGNLADKISETKDKVINALPHTGQKESTA